MTSPAQPRCPLCGALGVHSHGVGESTTGFEVVPAPAQPAETLSLERVALHNRVQSMSIWHEVALERSSAHAKHGDTSMESQPATSLDRLFILVEEVGEVAELFYRASLMDPAMVNRDHLKETLALIVRAGMRARGINDARHAGQGPQPSVESVDTAALRPELIQVAAMSGAWADAIASEPSS